MSNELTALVARAMFDRLNDVNSGAKEPWDFWKDLYEEMAAEAIAVVRQSDKYTREEMRKACADNYNAGREAARHEAMSAEPPAAMSDAALCALLEKAERTIQTAMLDLEEALAGSGWRADHVEMDTRTFANMKAEVLVSKAVVSAS